MAAKIVVDINKAFGAGQTPYLLKVNTYILHGKSRINASIHDFYYGFCRKMAFEDEFQSDSAITPSPFTTNRMKRCLQKSKEGLIVTTTEFKISSKSKWIRPSGLSIYFSMKHRDSAFQFHCRLCLGKAVPVF